MFCLAEKKNEYMVHKLFILQLDVYYQCFPHFSFNISIPALEPPLLVAVDQ
jgi:hypothetical protein